jgi:hypothetical protein
VACIAGYAHIGKDVKYYTGHLPRYFVTLNYIDLITNKILQCKPKVNSVRRELLSGATMKLLARTWLNYQLQ